MKIGLVRHFKVDKEIAVGKLTWQEYRTIMDKYDYEDVIPTEVDLRGIGWNKCYSSSLPRAVITAKTIYDGEIKKIDEIIEVDMRVMTPIKGMNEMKGWSIYSFLGWAKNQDDMGEKIDDTRIRANKFLDRLKDETGEDDNVLVVCHGMIMTILDEELIKRGFTSHDDLVFAENGELYLYEK